MGKLKTTEEFKKEVYNLVNDEYTLLNDYINSKTKVKLKHNKCNNIYEVTPSDFIQGKRCPYCANINRNINKRLSHQEFINKLNDKGKLRDYQVISKYINTRTKIKVKHLKCDNIFEILPNKFLNSNQGCSYCYKSKLKTTEEFKKEVYNLVNDEYLVLGEYINNKTKILIKHNKCNHTYYVAPYHFLQDRRCPYCKRSKGEEKIIKYLESNNYEYEYQYSFEDCKYINKLLFDFKLENDDGRIILIEYDGKQHENGYFCYNEKDFKKQQIRDKIKNNYCNSHDNIDLYRINYRDYSIIEDILEEIIKKYE